MISADEVAAIARGIDGWLSDAQGRALFAAAAECSGRGVIVEIGSWKGRSTTWLAHGAKRRGLTVHAVDPHIGSRENPAARTYEAFIENVRDAGVLDSIHALVMTSADASEQLQGAVELLFVDGDHSVAGAARDAQLWLPRVMIGGTAMFHDVATSGYSGPRRAFQRMVCRCPGFHRLRRVGSMAIAERTDTRSPAQAVRSLLFGLLLYRYDLEGILKRVLRGFRRRLSSQVPTVSN